MKCELLKRRLFLKKIAAGVTGVYVSTLASSAYAHTYHPIKYHLIGNGWDRHRRREIIDKAMSIVNWHFLDTSILMNGYQVDGNNYHLKGDLWDITNPRSFFTGDVGLHDILRCQIVALQVQIDQRPELYIYAEYEKDKDAYGWANTNLVQVKFRKSGVDISGDFKIHLNTYYLGAEGYLSSPSFWAGTIAHEMLHNLGHLHIKDRSNPNYSRCQLIAHERAVYYQGAYRRGLNRPHIKCGGQWQG
ncbi:hypothetical protein [uncultured Rubinisphaera sp.]|uniref:hypothetical protein n=1 Tax=uncultured Rubinisphaera sp. TaxID=1678686 RepID=UPI0030D887D5|tara:strand:- start:652 stop:1389 length:738 start_codon:yes stop_codon:yes gene_type:complete